MGTVWECPGNPENDTEITSAIGLPLVLASDKCSNDEVREESRGIDLAQVHKQSQTKPKENDLFNRFEFK